MRDCSRQRTHFAIAPPLQVALDGRLKGDDTSLASSTLLADENNRDIFGLVISYSVKVFDALKVDIP